MDAETDGVATQQTVAQGYWVACVACMHYQYVCITSVLRQLCTEGAAVDSQMKDVCINGWIMVSTNHLSNKRSQVVQLGTWVWRASAVVDIATRYWCMHGNREMQATGIKGTYGVVIQLGAWMHQLCYSISRQMDTWIDVCAQGVCGCVQLLGIGVCMVLHAVCSSRWRWQQLYSLGMTQGYSVACVAR